MLAAAVIAPTAAADVYVGADLDGSGDCGGTWGPNLPEKVGSGTGPHHHVCVIFPP